MVTQKLTLKPMTATKIPCKSSRIYLRPFNNNDLDSLFSLHASPEVAKTTIDGIQSLETVKKHLESFIAHQEQFGFSQWAAFQNQDHKFIGRAGLTKRALNQEIGEQVEIRFAFLPEFWGLGYASEVSDCLVKFAKEQLNLKKLAAANGLNNEKSARVLTKCGFKHIKNTIPDGYAISDEIRYWELEL